jgi:hypothetical protein
MFEFIASFFLIVASISIIAVYISFRVPAPNVGYPSKIPAVSSFGLAFLMLATAGALMFAE